MFDTFVTVKLIAETCCSCGLHFGMDNDFRQRRLQDGKMFYCPNGHGQHYTDTELAKLKRENQALKTESEWQRKRRESAEYDLQHERYSHGATKGKLTKFKNRIAAGVCPCCNRTFQNVARHMTSQHPSFKDEKERHD